MFSTINQLKGNILISTDNIISGIFARSVVLICMDDENGTVGLILNKPISPISIQELDKENLLEGNAKGQILVYQGGPMEQDKAFFLHSTDYLNEDSYKISDDLAFTSNYQIMKDVILDKGPKDYLLSIGYTGWGTNQLETEIKDDAWMVAPVSNHLIFGVQSADKWRIANKSIGVSNIFSLSTYSGHA